MGLAKKLVTIWNRIYLNRSNASKVAYLRKQGATIGEGTCLLCRVDSFGSEPYLISVGSNCLLTNNMSLITHDGGVSVLNSYPGGKYFQGVDHDKMGRVTIGDNVYIGSGTFVMPGVTIGSNCIIGAHSVVTKDIPGDSVAAGAPAKVICTLDEYYEKAKAKGAFYPTLGLAPAEKKAYLMEHVK